MQIGYKTIRSKYPLQIGCKPHAPERQADERHTIRQGRMHRGHRQESVSQGSRPGDLHASIRVLREAWNRHDHKDYVKINTRMGCMNKKYLQFCEGKKCFYTYCG